MLSLPDYRQKQIVFFQSGIRDLKFSNQNIVIIDREGKTEYKLSCFKVFAIFIIGEITITSVLLDKIQKYGIALIMMKQNFRVYAVIGAETEGNVILRKQQYTTKNSLNLAKSIIRNKTENQLFLLQEIREKTEKQKQAVRILKNILGSIPSADGEKTLLGLEGTASREFFQQYFGEFGWSKRLPRTKYDPINTILDIGYTFLFHLIDAHLKLFGFDTYMGVYHQPFYLRKSLTCDLEEPFRCLVDRQIRKSFRLGQFSEKDFVVKKGQYFLKPEETKKYTKAMFEAILERKEEIFLYIQQYYRCIMKNETDIPFFIIGK